MEGTSHLKTRKQKINYLKGILQNKNSITEIMPQKVYMFMQTNEEDIFYQCTFDAGLPPVITDGKIIRYTWEDIQRLMKKPNHWCLPMDYGKHRPPFPTLESIRENEKNKLVLRPAQTPDIEKEDGKNDNNNAGQEVRG